MSAKTEFAARSGNKTRKIRRIGKLRNGINAQLSTLPLESGDAELKMEGQYRELQSPVGNQTKSPASLPGFSFPLSG
ncbi:hypothetical protein [Roseibium sp. SCP14]|uniref:hypothetical protein n=1 Tax=Roseibium sp. SCP14 TaxID=3141375 RepID=UPI00333B8080